MLEFGSNLKSKNPEVSGEFTCGSRSKDTNNICMCKAFYIIYKNHEKNRKIIYHYFSGTCLLIFFGCSLALSLSLLYIYVSYYRYGWMCACVFAYGVLISVITILMCATNFETLRRSLRPRLLLKNCHLLQTQTRPKKTRV
jgi:uncharacterized membrane protein